jgi:hypothetical protein
MPGSGDLYRIPRAVELICRRGAQRILKRRKQRQGRWYQDESVCCWHSPLSVIGLAFRNAQPELPFRASK